MNEMNKPNIYLVGFRCTGKSSVGKILSGLLDRPFADTDQIIQETMNLSISEMVDQHGWDYFRAVEKKILRQLSSDSGHIISTGGGIVLDPENRELLKTTGTTIWLAAEEKIILERILFDPATAVLRPSLTQKDLGTEINDLMADRVELYRESAQFMIDTSIHSPDQIAHKILRRLSHERV